MGRKNILVTMLLVISAHIAAFCQSSESINESISVDNNNEVDTTKVYTEVEQRAQFPGGDKELIKYLAWNLKHPHQWCDTEHIEGRVVVRFVVKKDGTITNIEIFRSLDKAFDKEAVRLVEQMPKWIPAKQNGEDVDAYCVIPITFKLQR